MDLSDLDDALPQSPRQAESVVQPGLCSHAHLDLFYRVAAFDLQNIWIYLYALEIALFFSVSFWLLLRWQNRSKLNKEKLHVRLIMLFLTVYYVGGLITTIILPFFEIYQYQLIGLIICNIYAV